MTPASGSAATEPRLSIVTAVLNGLDLLRLTAGSVLAQRFDAWEWVVIDDASSEPVTAFLRQLGDARVRVLSNGERLGQTRSLNRGLAASRADWIVRLDGDDVMLPDRLAALASAMRAPSADDFAPLLFSDYDVIDATGAPVASIRYQPGAARAVAQLLQRGTNPLCHPTVAFYKYHRDGRPFLFDERLANAQDYALWRAIDADYGVPFRHVPVTALRYRLVRQSLSGKRIREQQAELRAIRRGRVETLGDQGRRVLNEREQHGMCAARWLNYQFLGVGANAFPAGWPETVRTLRQAAAYAPGAAAAVLSFAAQAGPWRGWLKRRLYRGVFA